MGNSSLGTHGNSGELKGRLIQPPNGSLIRRPHHRLNHDKAIQHPTLRFNIQRSVVLRRRNVDPWDAVMWTCYFNIGSVPSRDKSCYMLDNNSKQAVVGAIFNIHSVPIKEQKLYTGRQQQTSNLLVEFLVSTLFRQRAKKYTLDDKQQTNRLLVPLK